MRRKCRIRGTFRSPALAANIPGGCACGNGGLRDHDVMLARFNACHCEGGPSCATGGAWHLLDAASGLEKAIACIPQGCYTLRSGYTEAAPAWPGQLANRMLLYDRAGLGAQPLQRECGSGLVHTPMQDLAQHGYVCMVIERQTAGRAGGE